MKKRLAALALSVSCTFFPCHFSLAATAERVTVETRIKTEVARDLAALYQPGEGLSGRTCLGGRSVGDVTGDIVECGVA